MHRRIITASSTRAEDGRSVTSFLASTGGEARDGHVVEQAGWDLEDYRRNPVILWAHDGSLPPIGRAIRAEVGPDGLEIDVEWDEGSEMGATVARQYREGFLHAVSVGWMPLQATPRSRLPADHPAAGSSGLYFERQTLLELSAVPVGADPMALARAGLPVREQGADPSEVRAMVLDLLTSDPEVQRAVADAREAVEAADFWRALTLAE
jgi:hypothetical protein